VLAGNHGDEYEGQVAALRLLQSSGRSRCRGA
jgi:predicted deacylase